MRIVERPFSDFLRSPNDVLAELDGNHVVLRRRNAPALRLSLQVQEESRSEAFEALARLLRNMAVHSPAGFGGALDDAFGWSTFLPSSDRELFVQELTQTLLGAAEIESFSPVAQLIQEWKATAEIHADPALAKRLQSKVEADGQLIESPGE